MSHKIVMSCSACGAKDTFVAKSAGAPNHIMFAHEKDCPFYDAVETGKGEEWVAEHGYPMTMAPIDPKGES